MQLEIQKSVGDGGANLSADVTVVQTLLIKHGFRRVSPPDGVCGKKTLAAIEAFQRQFARKPDRRVDPHGRTWRRLVSFEHHPPVVPSAFTRLVAKPAAHTINQGVTPVSNAFMAQMLGSPRENYSTDCQPVTNAKLRRNMVVSKVGNFRVQGLSPAVDSLTEVFADIGKKIPDLYELVGTAGMLCCRLQRGSAKSISNHSWGTAIDLTIDGVLDARGDNKVQTGLTLLCPIFNQHGWYWGAAFPTEDGMHFEAGADLVAKWSKGLK